MKRATQLKPNEQHSLFLVQSTTVHAGVTSTNLNQFSAALQITPPMDLSRENTAEILLFAEHLARDAGSMIRTAFHTQRGEYDRKSATDPVTETDRAVEQKLFDAIRDKFPDHAFIGEESAAAAEWTSAPTWIVDPIDGTANCTSFVTGLAFPQCRSRIGRLLTVCSFSPCTC